MSGQWSGWSIRDAPAVLARLHLLEVPLVHPVLVLDHVTHAYPALGPAVPEPALVRIIGWAADARIQALVVKVDGRLTRPDGRQYHITLSKRLEAADKESNDMLQKADYREIPSFLIDTTPFIRSI